MFAYPITAHFHAEAAPQAVWAAFEAVARWPEVIPDLGFARIEPPGPLAAGALIRASAGPREAPVEIEYRVTLAEPPRRLTLESDTLDWNGRTEYTIEPDGAGSRLIVASTMEVIGTLLRVQMFVVGRTLNAQREAALRERSRALLTLAERIAQTPPPP
jgi:hypothetical protein